MPPPKQGNITRNSDDPAEHNFFFIVRDSANYSKSTRQTFKALSADARSHAALAHHRKKYQASLEDKQIEKPLPLSSRLLRPKPPINASEDADTNYAEDDRSQMPAGNLAIASVRLPEINASQQVLPSLSYPIDILPGVRHREIPGFRVAVDFYRMVSPHEVHAPVFHIFNVSNTFDQCYYELIRSEVGLSAGVAVVNMVRDVWRHDFHKTGPSPHVRQLIQIAMMKLRQTLLSGVVTKGKASQKTDTVESDAAITAALFLGHACNAFGDSEAFRMHRNGIRTMVDTLGGHDSLGLDGMVKASVLQFESWWTHLYNDTSVFAAYRPTYSATYLSPPFSASAVLELSRLPPVFALLAKDGRLATDIITILSRIVSHYHLIHPSHRSTSPRPNPFLSSPSKKTYADFHEATSCLLIQGPHYEKYFVFALLLFVSVAFAGSERDRGFLACSHTAFRTPRVCLTRELPVFDSTGKDGGEAQVLDEDEVETAEKEGLLWMWMALIWSWIATDGLQSHDARLLMRGLKAKFPRYRDWSAVDNVMRRCFWMEEMCENLKRCFSMSS